MASFDLHPEHPLYHGGSFNGNVLGMVAGAIALRDLSAEAIARIDDQADRLRAEIAAAAATRDLPVRTAGVGSAFGVYVLDGPGGEIDWPACSMLHLAAVTRASCTSDRAASSGSPPSSARMSSPRRRRR